MSNTTTTRAPGQASCRRSSLARPTSCGPALLHARARPRRSTMSFFMQAGTGGRSPCGQSQEHRVNRRALRHPRAAALGRRGDAFRDSATEMCRRQQTGDGDCRRFRHSRWLPIIHERSRRHSADQPGTRDQTVAGQSGAYQRAFTIFTGFKIGVAMKKGQEPMLKALYDAIEVMRADGTEKRSCKQTAWILH